MSSVSHIEAPLLAKAVADCLALTSDTQAHTVSNHWRNTGHHNRAVAELMQTLPIQGIRDLVGRITKQPQDPGTYFTLIAELAALYELRPDVLHKPFEMAWLAECRSRLGYHMGENYSPTSAGSGSAQSTLSCAPRVTDTISPRAQATIVIPFRDQDGDGDRTRNLTACLHAISHQSVPRNYYRVVLVESDIAPRLPASLRNAVDSYIFAWSDRCFNKSWTVNAGIANSSADPGIICILDADMLVDHHFVERNIQRFRQPGRQAHVPYRDVLYLDDVSSAAAINARCSEPRTTVDLSYLRGFILRRPLGGCVWVRRDLFLEIGGFDERFEGWGGEDQDFALRLFLAGSVDTYDDSLIHLAHARPRMAKRGVVARKSIAPLSWKPRRPIGQLPTEPRWSWPQVS